MPAAVRGAVALLALVVAACQQTEGAPFDAGARADGGTDARDAAMESAADTPADGSAEGAAADAANAASDAGSDAGSDAVASCPAEIAACAARLQALKSECATDGVACERQVTGFQENRCYANGVRVYLDLSGITIVRGDGRTCYTVETRDQGASVVNVVRNRDGEEVIRAAHTLGAGYTTFTCGAAFADVPEGARSCGVLDTTPPSLQCEPGSCIRP